MTDEPLCEIITFVTLITQSLLYMSCFINPNNSLEIVCDRGDKRCHVFVKYVMFLSIIMIVQKQCVKERCHVFVILVMFYISNKTIFEILGQTLVIFIQSRPCSYLADMLQLYTFYIGYISLE